MSDDAGTGEALKVLTPAGFMVGVSSLTALLRISPKGWGSLDIAVVKWRMCEDKS